MFLSQYDTINWFRTIDIVFYHDIENVWKNHMQDNKNDVMHNVRQEQKNVIPSIADIFGLEFIFLFNQKHLGCTSQ